VTAESYLGLTGSYHRPAAVHHADGDIDMQLSTHLGHDADGDSPMPDSTHSLEGSTSQSDIGAPRDTSLSQVHSLMASMDVTQLCKEYMQRMVDWLQQYITVRLYMGKHMTTCTRIHLLGVFSTTLL
jgi:hypothetical protein